MNCPYCGAEIADGQAFCPVCGGSFPAPPEKDDVRRAKPRKQVNKKEARAAARRRPGGAPGDAALDRRA